MRLLVLALHRDAEELALLAILDPGIKVVLDAIHVQRAGVAGLRVLGLAVVLEKDAAVGVVVLLAHVVFLVG